MPEFKRGMVPISADPITNGHIDLILRAFDMCEEIVVLVANNDEKSGKYMFTLAQRLDMAERALGHMDGIQVVDWDGLLVDAFDELAVDVVFRGVRNDQDRADVCNLKGINSLILAGFEGHVDTLKTSSELEHVSSSTVKGLVVYGVDVSRLVPLHVKVALEEKILGVKLIGITGQIACGKSYVAERLAGRLGGTHVNMDKLLHDVYAEQTPGGFRLRRQIAEFLGDDVLISGGEALDRNVMRERLFGGEEADELRTALIKLTAPKVMRLLRRRLLRFKGWVIIEWAQLVEMGLTGMVNNRVIVVDADQPEVFMAKRGIAPGQVDQILEAQLGFDEKRRWVYEAIKHDRFGSAMTFHNNTNAGVFGRRMNTLLRQIEVL